MVWLHGVHQGHSRHYLKVTTSCRCQSRLQMGNLGPEKLTRQRVGHTTAGQWARPRTTTHWFLCKDRIEAATQMSMSQLYRSASREEFLGKLLIPCSSTRHLSLSLFRCHQGSHLPLLLLKVWDHPPRSGLDAVTSTGCLSSRTPTLPSPAVRCPHREISRGS